MMVGGNVDVVFVSISTSIGITVPWDIVGTTQGAVIFIVFILELDKEVYYFIISLIFEKKNSYKNELSKSSVFEFSFQLK